MSQRVFHRNKVVALSRLLCHANRRDRRHILLQYRSGHTQFLCFIFMIICFEKFITFLVFILQLSGKLPLKIKMPRKYVCVLCMSSQFS